MATRLQNLANGIGNFPVIGHWLKARGIPQYQTLGDGTAPETLRGVVAVIEGIGLTTLTAQPKYVSIGQISKCHVQIDDESRSALVLPDQLPAWAKRVDALSRPLPVGTAPVVIGQRNNQCQTAQNQLLSKQVSLAINLDQVEQIQTNITKTLENIDKLFTELESYKAKFDDFESYKKELSGIDLDARERTIQRLSEQLARLAVEIGRRMLISPKDEKTLSLVQNWNEAREMFCSANEAFEEVRQRFDDNCPNIWSYFRMLKKAPSALIQKPIEAYQSNHRLFWNITGAVLATAPMAFFGYGYGGLKILWSLAAPFVAPAIGWTIGDIVDSHLHPPGAKNLGDAFVPSTIVSHSRGPVISMARQQESAQRNLDRLRQVQAEIKARREGIKTLRKQQQDLDNLDEEIKEILESGALGKVGAWLKLSTHKVDRFDRKDLRKKLLKAFEGADNYFGRGFIAQLRHSLTNDFVERLRWLRDKNQQGNTLSPIDVHFDFLDDNISRLEDEIAQRNARLKRIKSRLTR